MRVTADMVKQLRDETGAPMMDCKQALEEAGGDLEQATKVLRKKGLAAAAKKSGRTTAEGVVGSYIHGHGTLGVLVEVNCETDFVARTDEFQELVKNIAMHIAAAEPRFVARGEVTPEILDREREIYREQALGSGKPPEVVDRVVEGKMEKFFTETVLLEQPYVKNPDITIGELLAEKIGKIGENIRVRRFTRYKLGERRERQAEELSERAVAEATRQG